jgi:transposase-like protein
VAKGKLVTTDGRREILGTKLGKEYSGVYVEGLENVERGNKGDEEIPRPFDQIRTIIDAIGYVIPWPTTHVSLIFLFEIVHVSVASSN